MQRGALVFGTAARAIDTDAVDVVAVSDTMAVDFCQGGGRSVDEDEEGKKQICLGELHDDVLEAEDVWRFGSARRCRGFCGNGKERRCFIYLSLIDHARV